MATYDLEEQEQLAEMKAWWNQYGTLVTGLLLAAALGMAAWQGWNWYQREEAAKASLVFSSLQRAVLEQDIQKTKTAAGELLEKYSSSTYAPLGALTAGKMLFDTGDLKTAQLQYTWVVNNGKDELRDLARLRLANVLLDQKAYDEALKQLDTPPGSDGFSHRFLETRGDILAAQGKVSEARKAYQQSLEKLTEVGKAGSQRRGTLQSAEATAPYRQMVQQKLDALGAEG